MNLEEAKEKVIQAIKENKLYISEYEIDEDEIMETDLAWYIPFKDIHPINTQTILIGAYYGFIVGKVHGDLYQPGSGYSIGKWLRGYELGILHGAYDLIITRINNIFEAKKCLKRLNLRYYKPEIENGITWKIPKIFTEEMIDKRLANLPCRFINQGFVFNIEEFEEINTSKMFEYELVRNVDAMPNEIGERIE